MRVTIFSPSRGSFDQNQFGGTLGGPATRNKIFFYSDYQGTRQTQGVDTGLIPVPSIQDRSGNLADLASSLVTTVSGPAWATALSQNLGYQISVGEPYYFPGCTNTNYSATSTTACVLPTLQIPNSAWSAPAQHLSQYIPAPNQPGNVFSTSAYNQTLNDNKGAARFDASTPWGLFILHLLFPRRLHSEQSLPHRAGWSKCAGLQRAESGPRSVAQPGQHQDSERNRGQRIPLQLPARRQ